MTTIAWDGKTLAADGRLATQGGVLITEDFKKIFKLNTNEFGQVLVGVSGDAADMMRFIKHLSDDNKLSDFAAKPEDWFRALIVTIGRVLLFEKNYYYEVPNNYAIGSGDYFARSALTLGYSAENAVQHAATFDLHTNNNVQTLTFDSAPF